MKEKKQKSTLLSSAAVMSVIILLSKLLGLFRDTLVANFYGTGTESVAYTAASKLPVTIFDLIIGGVVSAAFIPVFNSVLVKKGKKDAMRFANSYVNLIIIVCVVMTVIGIVFAQPLIGFIAPDIPSDAAALAVKLTRIMFPMIIFTGLAFSFVGILQSMGEYNLPALISLVSNCIMVAYLFTLNRFFGIIGLAVAMLLGWASQAFIQLPKAYSLGFRYSPRANILDPDIFRAAKNALPILIGTWTTPICNLINTRLASGIDNGRAITALDYANRLYTMIVGIFSFVATNLLFPYFSRAEAEGDREGASRLIRTSIKTLIYIIAPITVGVICLAEPFTAIVYERGQFTASDTAITAEALSRYAVGMIFMAANEVLVKALFAANKPRIPMISSIAICNLINTRLASGIDNGRAITALDYANRLYTMIVGIFSFVATNLLFPYFSRAEAEGDREGASRLIRTSIKTLIYIIAPITVGVICLAEPFTAIVYERGQFTASDTAITAEALSRYAVGMIFMAANEVLVKALFAANKPRIPMISSIASMVFNILLVTVFGDLLGVGEIALVCAVATVINLAINLIAAHRTGVCRFVGRDAVDIATSVLCACVMIPVIILVSSFSENVFVKLALSVCAAAPVYFAASLLLRSEEACFIAGGVTKKLKKQ